MANGLYLMPDGTVMVDYGRNTYLARQIQGERL
jgi:hypothetical protein